MSKTQLIAWTILLPFTLIGFLWAWCWGSFHYGAHLARKLAERWS